MGCERRRRCSAGVDHRPAAEGCRAGVLRGQHRGWRRLLKPGRDKWVWNYTHRNGLYDKMPLKAYLQASEDMIMPGHDGIGYLCSDFVPIHNPKSRRQKYYQLKADRGCTQGGNTGTLVAAGPGGPVVTGRYEMLREGCQQCEAILYIERALQEKKIAGELAQRANAYLDERSRAFIKSDWPIDRQDLDRRLFELAAEASGVTGTGAEK